jgi:uncharacterized protein YegP (UPF0339 family)
MCHFEISKDENKKFHRKLNSWETQSDMYVSHNPL